MRSVPSWSSYFVRLTREVATRSKDPQTNVGALAIGSDFTIHASGYNGFPRRLRDTPERWQSGIKGKRVLHAEANILVAAARHGIRLGGSTLYVSILPCPECCKLIVGVEFDRVVIDRETYEWYATTNPTWFTQENIELCEELLREGGISLSVESGGPLLPYPSEPSDYEGFRLLT